MSGASGPGGRRPLLPSPRGAEGPGGIPLASRPTSIRAPHRGTPRDAAAGLLRPRRSTRRVGLCWTQHQGGGGDRSQRGHPADGRRYHHRQRGGPRLRAGFLLALLHGDLAKGFDQRRLPGGPTHLHPARRLAGQDNPPPPQLPRGRRIPRSLPGAVGPAGEQAHSADQGRD